MTAALLLKQQVLALPPDERAELLRRLEESLTGEFQADAKDASYSELNRRIKRLMNGSARAIPADEARRRARAHLAKLRG